MTFGHLDSFSGHPYGSTRKLPCSILKAINIYTSHVRVTGDCDLNGYRILRGDYKILGTGRFSCRN
ncbi:MAG: hypothetical protein WCI18_13575 [Pseudomonadota bacterium]